ncbi:MAG: hypothetical protein PVF46_00805 [Lysobacterales bacterium]|jgi:hypothetical protein
MNDDARKPAEHMEHAEEGTEDMARIEREPVKGGDVSRMAKNVGLFFASPFVALGYVIALPFVAMYQFIKLTREARAKKKAAE